MQEIYVFLFYIEKNILPQEMVWGLTPPCPPFPTAQEILQSKTRSKDLKTQKLQGSILKAVWVISKVTDTLRNLKNSKNLILMIWETL